MSSKLPAFFLVLIFSLGFASRAYAQDQEFDRTGPYLGAGWTYAFEEFDDSGLDTDDSWGINAYAGIRFDPHYAMELAFDWYEGFEVEFEGDDVLEIDVWSLTLNAKPYLLTGRVQPYVLLGAGIMTADGKFVGFSSLNAETRFMWRAGAGIDIYLTEKIVLRIDGIYNFPTSSLDVLEFWTLGGGLQYRF